MRAPSRAATRKGGGCVCCAARKVDAERGRAGRPCAPGGDTGSISAANALRLSKFFSGRSAWGRTRLAIDAMRRGPSAAIGACPFCLGVWLLRVPDATESARAPRTVVSPLSRRGTENSWGLTGENDIRSR
jgi:hypothetical protein